MTDGGVDEFDGDGRVTDGDISDIVGGNGDTNGGLGNTERILLLIIILIIVGVIMIVLIEMMPLSKNPFFNNRSGLVIQVYHPEHQHHLIISSVPIEEIPIFSNAFCHCIFEGID